MAEVRRRSEAKGNLIVTRDNVLEMEDLHDLMVDYLNHGINNRNLEDEIGAISSLTTIASLFGAPGMTLAGVALMIASVINTFGKYELEKQAEVIFGGKRALKYMRLYLFDKYPNYLALDVNVLFLRYEMTDNSMARFIQGNTLGDPSVVFTINRIKTPGGWEYLE